MDRDTNVDIKMDGHRKAPVWFWISLVLIILASIIAYFIFQYDKERDQLEMEKKTTYNINRLNLAV